MHKFMTMAWGCLLVMIGCDNPDKDYTYQEENVASDIDPDQDGYFGDEDCDETSPAIHNGASEICDGIDNNCDGEIDEGVLITYYFDADGDDFGDSQRTEQGCFPIDGYVSNGNDCNDEDENIYPGALEVCDEVDNDCNELIDDGLGYYWFFDEDGDGYGSINTATQSCTQPEGSMTTGGDCDDENAQIFPGVDEECDGVDNNCNGQIDETGSDRWYMDSDGDGFGNPSEFVESCISVEGYIDNNFDCDDADELVHPDGVEVCDEIDNNCNGILNENALDGYPWYEDSDMDGYGNPTVQMISCTQPIGYSANADDCNDANVSISPAALEFCNEIDDDCDGVVDDSDVVDFEVFFADVDEDGFGDPSNLIQACEQGTGMVSNNQDCDDGNSDIYPYATEVCNGIDDNCNTVIDEGSDDLQLYYQDNDGDGFGSSVTQLACSGAAGFSSVSGDCNDGDASINPDAVEVCDFVDNNCDGAADENFPTSAWYEDSDGDAYGSNTQRMYHCQQPAGYIATSGDCNDTDAGISPSATEICDFIDNDCDGGVDEGISTNLWFLDTDGDGFGTNSLVQYDCQQPVGYTSTGGDCDDGDSAINPNAVEICNAVDDDCDGGINEGLSTSSWYEDGDGDGFGSNSTVQYYCQQPSGYVSVNGDCDDSNSSINPSAMEVCNAFDDNCDGDVDEGMTFSSWFADTDGDSFGSDTVVEYSCQQPSGYVSVSGDCDDGNASINPNNAEICNNADDDCDGSIDEGFTTSPWYEDADGDSYGTNSSIQYYCQQPSGYVATNGDCNDADAGINPSATEACNNADDDCDGSIDEGLPVDPYYIDLDTDGFGNTALVTYDCQQPSGYVTSGGDCDDSNAGINPNATEVCNANDDDCNGSIDEGLPTTVWYRDGDADGFGNDALSTYNCQQPEDYVANNDDCEDGDAGINPSATEVCNGLDDDCDNSADAGFLGKDLICVADSCLDIINAHPSATDGEYTINFPSGVEQAQCDMGSFGGGWTQVFMDDMDPPDPGWTLQTTSTCGIWGQILGGYNVISGGSFDNNISTRGLPHSQVWVEMDYITLDSWDETTSQWGPDIAFVQFDGNYIWYTDIDNHLSIYGQVCGWYRPSYPQGSYDSRHYVSTIENGNFTNFTITAGSTLSQGPTDESFGLDDVYVWVR